MPRSGGMTLIEVLVALTIFTLTAGVALEALRGTTLLAESSDSRLHALAHAENAIVQAKVNQSIQQGPYRIEISVRPYRQGLQGVRSLDPLVNEVIAKVSWLERGAQRSVTLTRLSLSRAK